MFEATFIAALPFIVLVIAAVAGIFFLGWWFARGRTHPSFFLWGIGFLFLFSYKLPSVFLHAGVTNFTQEELNPYLFLTLVLYFVALFVFIKGLSYVRPDRGVKTFFERYFPFWAAAAVVYFFLSLFVPAAAVSYAPVWMGHVLFFIPAQLFLLQGLWRLKNRPEFFAARQYAMSAVFGALLLVVSSLQYIAVQVTAIKRSYWYFASISSWETSLVQVLSAAFLFVGFFGIARVFLKISPQDVAVK